MKKVLILLMFILMPNFFNVLADIPPLPFPSPPVKEEKPHQPPVRDENPIKLTPEPKPGGFCFAPTVIAGTLLSLSIISFGWRFIRFHQSQQQLKETIN